MSAQPNDFRYFLTYKNKRTEIVFAPDGWDTDTDVSYERNMTYFGLTRSLSLPLQFVFDGADILRSAYYQDSFEAGVRFEVEQLQKSKDLSSVWSYKSFFIGDIDFSQFKDNKDHVSVTLMESGASRDVKAFESVKYEYPLSGDDVINIILPGVQFDESSTSIFIPQLENRDRYIPGSEITSESFQSGFVEVQSPELQNVTDTDFSSSGNWFVKANRAVDVRVKGTTKGVFFKNVSGTRGFRIIIVDNTNTEIATIYANNTQDIVNFDFPFDLTVPMITDQKLFFYFRTDFSPGPQGLFLNDGEFTVSYNSVSDPSNCKGISAPNLFKRIMAKISPGSVPISYLLENTWKDLIFTSGDGIREITEPSIAKIKITFKEFFDTINGIDDVGFGVEKNRAVLELATYFARSMQIIDLGEVKDCSIEPAQELIFNSIKIGYDDGNTDETNGRQEYNSGQVWAMPISRFQKEKNWVSPTRADQFGIEKIRVDYNVKKTDKATNDTSSDNDPFMIYCYRDGDNYRPVLGSSYDSVTGLTSPLTAYNLELSPKKNLLRHSGYLRGVLDKMDGRYISFGSGEKNTALVTVKDGIVVKENEDIISSSLTGKYFIPAIATFTTKMPRDTMWIVDNMPYGYITFKWRNTILKGYIMKITMDIARNTEQEFKLLLTNDNNLLNLI